ncbi:DUF1033 family protein [Sporosarcina aquimarina]|uniref:DUF1033 family protein n=1 Tax=Sporosarcina aquimarina TaxID=114975 RepID=A0ABU4FXY2_9BACL|nr:DUF1033 family protein [Sporosarcina aquimarina]MDW0109563.1 DUF1033 family protein [Sporosarcina aquimarina]
MYEVIYMKADYEPWWMFEDWEEMVRIRKNYDELEEAVMYANSIINEMRNCFAKEKSKKGSFIAFWNPGERTYCDGCDEDMQLYHGVFLLKDLEPIIFLNE